ncbi:hypothetical protein [Magnetospirillum gryphiswaldense]|nr:hypothetical protein [Magnetospirillum gryphiswaldense]
MAKDDNKIAALAMIQGIIDSATELAAVASVRAGEKVGHGSAPLWC